MPTKTVTITVTVLNAPDNDADTTMIAILGALDNPGGESENGTITKVEVSR